MNALDRKLWRDLARMWGQAITIALVVACGVATYVTMRAAHASLVDARDREYDSARFAHVFVEIERAPEALSARLEEIPGVARVSTRVVEDVLLPMPGMADPAVGRVIGLPETGPPPLDALVMRDGRAPEPGRDDEAVVLAAFADAHHLEPGDRVPVVLNGTLRELRVVGVALSPEFVFAARAGELFQDDKRFAVLWMNRDAVAAAFRMEGSFDDALMTLQPGASPEHVIADTRRLLAPYGVLHAVARARQASNYMLESELRQLGTFAVITPAIFLAVAAFLVNIVLARTLHLQRSQIAMLKAIGYRNIEIAVHYAKFVGVVMFAGAVLGVAIGAALGNGMIAMYRPFFRFPDLELRLDPGIVAGGVLMSLVTGFAGGLSAVARAVRVAPAEAMRPESPATYRRPLVERIGVQRLLSVSGRMVMREMFRRPLRAALSSVGIAFATAVIVCAYFMNDSLEMLTTVAFEVAQRDDVEATFRKPVGEWARREAATLPGVIEVEPRRYVPVRASFEQRERDVVLIAVPARDHPLREPTTWPTRPFRPPPEGVVVSAALLDVLGARVGSRIHLELQEGDRRNVSAVVAGTIPDLFGLTLYASPETVRRIVGEEGSVSSVLFTVDRRDEDALVARLADMRNIAAITRRSESYAAFMKQTGFMWTTMAVLTGFGAVIAFGVIYNQARIALSMRSRDLASLRVLGFHRAEISAVLLGELAVYVMVGIPLGFVFGKALVDAVMSSVDPEVWRLPGYVSARTYAFAAIATLVAAGASALVVRRKLDRLDLIAVLKTRE